MNELYLLEREIGGRWIGLTLHHDTVPDGELAKRPMRFCEAVSEAKTGPLVLTPELVDCPGALRSLGWATSDDETMAQTMAKETDFAADIALKVIKNTPCLNEKIVAVTVGSDDSPDVVLSYAQPVAAMKLIRRWQELNGTDLRINGSTVMAVCGSVAVRAYLTGQICLSCGCPTSRKYGAIWRNRLVIGMPFSLIEMLCEK